MSSKIATILIIFSFHQTLYGTRLPLEVFEVPSTTTATTSQIHHNSDTTNVQQQQQFNIHFTPSQQQQQHNHHQQQQRKGRQIIEIKTPRILYQVGNSEDDLPICAQNAVCSKVDLYETPWIERQCRCPDINKHNNLQPQRIIYHHKDNKFIEQKYQQYFDDDKRIQQKHLLDLNNNNNNNNNENSNHDEHRHIRDILRKLGTIYNSDDIMLSDDYEQIENNSNYLYQHNNQNNKKNNQNQNNQRQKNLQKFNSKNIIEQQQQTQQSQQLQQHNQKRLRHSSHRIDFPKVGGCSSYIGIEDGHTIADKTRQYKLCEPIHKLPTCRYFRDYTWTLKSSPEANATEQVVHCKCPKNSVTYLIKREPIESGKLGYTYLFACSPQSRLRCYRKEPCKLFTVRKRQEFLDEVNTNPLCQCPRGHSCPKHHTDTGVISGKSYIEDNIRTYSGYCMSKE